MPVYRATPEVIAMAEAEAIPIHSSQISKPMHVTVPASLQA